MKKKIKPFKEIMKQIIKKILNVGGHLLEILNNFINFLKDMFNHMIKEFKEFLNESKKPSEDLIDDMVEKVEIFEEEKEEKEEKEEEIKSEAFKPHKFTQIMKDPVDTRDILFNDRHCMASTLPKKIDLRNLYNNKIEDQGDIGSCTGQGATSLMEFVNHYLYKKPAVELSAMYLYYKERELEGTINKDYGATVRSGMKVLQKNGVCRDLLWPYKPEKLMVKPPIDCDVDAINYKIKGYQRVNGVDEIKNALKINHPVLIGMKLYESFDTKMTAIDGIIPVPNITKEKYLGSHCMLIVGYDDNKNGGSFIIQNSWGPKWGDRGHCYVPYSCCKYMHDQWTIIENDNSTTGLLDLIFSLFSR